MKPMWQGNRCSMENDNDNDIILIQEHWFFHSQTSIISDINSDISFVAKGVDINDPLLPYGRVAILWKKTINHLVRTLPDGCEKIQ